MAPRPTVEEEASSAAPQTSAAPQLYDAQAGSFSAPVSGDAAPQAYETAYVPEAAPPAEPAEPGVVPQAYEAKKEAYEQPRLVEGAAPIPPAGDPDTDEDFNWDTDEELDQAGIQVEPKTRAKRGRRAYELLQRTPRFVRMLVYLLAGGVISVVPLIVVRAGFDANSHCFQGDCNVPGSRPACNLGPCSHVEAWSVWITIIWVAGVATFLVLGWVPPAMLKIADMFGHVPELYRDIVRIVSNCLPYVQLTLCVVWAWISLGGTLAIKWSNVNRTPYWTTVIHIVTSLFATCIVVLAEKVLLSVITMHFHKTAMRDRLEKNRFAFAVLAKLQQSRSRGVSSGLASRAAAGARGAYASGKSAVTGGARAMTGGMQTLTRRGKQSTPGTPADGAVTPKTPGAEPRAVRRNAFASQLQSALTTAAKRTQLSDINMPQSSIAARRLARDLFMHLSTNGRTVLPSDFMTFFATEREAYEAFSIFDADHNGDISRSEMRQALERIFDERKYLDQSTQDMRSAFRNLDFVLLFLVLIIVVFIWLAIFTGDQTVSNLVPLSTIVVGFSFVFGNTAKNIFESMIFIFSTHPYDVGDLVCVDDTWMFVVEFGMISTVFRTVFNEIVVIPNATLASEKSIFNSRRSGPQWETMTVMTSFQTPLHKIDAFRAKLQEFVKENDREWGGGLELLYDSIRNMNCLSLVIAVEHKGNWQDWGTRWTRRTRFMRRIKEAAEELGLSYEPPLQPIAFVPHDSAMFGRQPHSAPHPASKHTAAMQPQNGLLSASQIPPATLYYDA